MNAIEIPVSRCRPAAYNPRRTRDEETLAELVESVKQHGVLVPVLARQVKENGRTCYEVVAGSRRLAAAISANVPRLPAVVRVMSDVEALEVSVLENLQRELLDPIEEARGVRALQEVAGWDAEKVARRLSRSERWVQTRMGFLELPEEAQEAISAGSLALAATQLLLDLKGEDRDEALKAILHPTYQEKPLAGWEACRMIDQEYLQPARLRAAWEKLVASGKLQKEWPGARILAWDEEPDGWFREVEDHPLPYELAVHARGKETPTWGELAAKHGAQVYLFPGAKGEGVACIECEALIDAERALCVEAGEECIFPQAGPGSGEAKHQQDLAAAKVLERQEAAERKERKALVEAIWNYHDKLDGPVCAALLEHLADDWSIGGELTGARLGKSDPTEEEVQQELRQWGEEFGAGGIQRILLAEELLRTTVRERVEPLLAAAGIKVDKFPTLYPE